MGNDADHLFKLWGFRRGRENGEPTEKTHSQPRFPRCFWKKALGPNSNLSPFAVFREAAQTGLLSLP